MNIFIIFVKIKISYYFTCTDTALKQIINKTNHGLELDQLSGLRRCPVYGGRKQIESSFAKMVCKMKLLKVPV